MRKEDKDRSAGNIQATIDPLWGLEDLRNFAVLMASFHFPHEVKIDPPLLQKRKRLADLISRWFLVSRVQNEKA